MILAWLIIIPLAGGLAAWVLGRWGNQWPRWVSLAAALAQLALAGTCWAKRGPMDFATSGLHLQWPWIPQLGISFHLAADGISLLLVLLTSLVGVLAVAVSWTEIRHRVGFFHLNLMWVLAGITGVFVAMDLFLFYFFWELMLVPMYFLIDIWGHENRHYAAVKFFLFTQISGLLMLLAILALYFVHGRSTGEYTFDYTRLARDISEHRVVIRPTAATWMMLGFLAAFLVKLPAVPLHTWLPDAHTEAPTAGSLVLAALLLKTGAYGLIRFVVPLFPQAAHQFAPVAMTLGVIGILYGAAMAFAQSDFKRLVAYTSVSHLGFVLMGVFAWNAMALQGAVMQMICHGLSTGALFILAGMIGERLGTRDMRRMGGLWASAPRMGALAMFFALASLGLPGLGNFVAEFLVLLGTYQVSIAATAAACLGLVAATVYSLWLMQQTFLGTAREDLQTPDASRRELAILLVLATLLVGLGLHPQPVLDTAGASLEEMRRSGQWTGVSGQCDQFPQSTDHPPLTTDHCPLTTSVQR